MGLHLENQHSASMKDQGLLYAMTCRQKECAQEVTPSQLFQKHLLNSQCPTPPIFVEPSKTMEMKLKLVNMDYTERKYLTCLQFHCLRSHRNISNSIKIALSVN